MYESSELRWFLPEADLTSFPTLFPKSAPGDEMNCQETRTDVYRVVPGADIIGLKVRGDAGLELKALRAAPEPFHWPPSAAPNASVVLGRADLWIKWDLPERDGEKLMPAAQEVHVEKVRWTRKFSADHRLLQTVRAHPPGPNPASGCNVERAELKVGRERWLSLGFEAFGDPARLRAILAACVQSILGHATDAEIAQLSEASSQSYPVWLDAYVKRNG